MTKQVQNQPKPEPKPMTVQEIIEARLMLKFHQEQVMHIKATIDKAQKTLEWQMRNIDDEMARIRRHLAEGSYQYVNCSGNLGQYAGQVESTTAEIKMLGSYLQEQEYKIIMWTYWCERADEQEAKEQAAQ